MAASQHSSKATTTDPGDSRDPEALGKAGDDLAKDGDYISEKGPSPWEATLDKSEDPKTMATWCKWAIVLTISAGAMCVTCASSMVSYPACLSPVGSNMFL